MNKFQVIVPSYTSTNVEDNHGIFKQMKAVKGQESNNIIPG